MTYELETLQDSKKIQSLLKKFLLNFMLDEYKVSLFCIALSEAMVNVLRYANNGSVTSMYTPNKKGIEIRIDDNGNGMENLDECLRDGYTSKTQSLGLGLGVMQRSVDEFIINKSDNTGTSISLKIYKNQSLYDSVGITHKKEGEVFNGDGYIDINYDGDVSLYAVLDGAGHGKKANQSMLLVHDCILEHKRLSLDTLLIKCHKVLQSAALSRGVDVAIVRLQNEKLDYIVLGNTFIKSFPSLYFRTHYGSLGKEFPSKLEVFTYDLEKDFALSMCTDGLKRTFNLQSLYINHSARTLATYIFNANNLDDDSTIIVVKRGYKDAK